MAYAGLLASIVLVSVLTWSRWREAGSSAEAEVVDARQQPISAPTVESEPKTEPEPEPQPAPQPEVEAAPERTAPPGPDAIPLILVENGLLVLDDAADSAWGRGAIYDPPGTFTDEVYRVGKSVDPSQLPASLLQLRGRIFDLYDAEGKRCSARAGALHVINRYGVNEFGGRALEGPIDDATWDVYGELAKIPEAVWRDAVWRYPGHWLVAEILPEGDCKGAMWARDASLPPPVILALAPRGMDNPVAQARVAAFQQSKQRAELRAAYQAWYAGLRPEQRDEYDSWDQVVADSPAGVSSWIDAAGSVRVVELWFGGSTTGCYDGESAYVNAVELVRGEAFVDMGVGSDPTIVAIFDADLDGSFEVLQHGYLSSRVTSATETLRRDTKSESDFYCGC